MKVKLTEYEKAFLIADVLKNNLFLIKTIENATMDNSKYLLDIGDSLADEIRDLCSEELQIRGFDENYMLNEDGKILEYLIDIFYGD